MIKVKLSSICQHLLGFQTGSGIRAFLGAYDAQFWIFYFK